MNEVYKIKSVNGEVLLVYEDHVVITHRGIVGWSTRGLAGAKTIFYSSISSIQFKRCGWTPGFIGFAHPGSGSLSVAPVPDAFNENCFTFIHPLIWRAGKLNRQMEEVRDYIQKQVLRQAAR